MSYLLLTTALQSLGLLLLLSFSTTTLASHVSIILIIAHFSISTPKNTGTDCLAKAKTGTGKTLGFLIPAVEKVLKGDGPKGGIPCLIMSPTRELAAQITAELDTLLTYVNT